MAKSKRELRVVLPALENTEERSSLFWWVLKHHDAMLRAAGGRRIRWKPLCEKFTRLGLRDGAGNPPSTEAARRTWRHVRAVATKAAQVPPQRSRAWGYPSRIPADWRPQEVTPKPPDAGLPVALPAPATAADPSAELVEPYDPIKNIARLHRLIAERSGRKV